jgi:hypothetical protein
MPISDIADAFLNKAFNTHKAKITSNSVSDSIFDSANKKTFHYPLILSNVLSNELIFDLRQIVEFRTAQAISLAFDNRGDVLEINDKSISDWLATQIGSTKLKTTDTYDLLKDENYKVNSFLKKEFSRIFKVPEDEIEFLKEDDGIETYIKDRFNKPEKNFNLYNQHHNGTKDNSNISSKSNIDKDSRNLPNKLNSLKPVVINITISILNKKGEVSNFGFKVAVKTIIHIVNSDDLTTAISKSLNNSNYFLVKLIRWTTGELSFFKDLLLNYNERKYFANNNNKLAFTIIDRLINAKTLSNISKEGRRSVPILGAKDYEQASSFINDNSSTSVLPTTTLILTNSEVDEIRRLSGYSLKNPKVAKLLFEKIHLASFSIVDPVNMTMLTMDNGKDSEFEVSDIKKNQDNNNQLKSVLSAMVGNY